MFTFISLSIPFGMKMKWGRMSNELEGSVGAALMSASAADAATAARERR